MPKTVAAKKSAPPSKPATHVSARAGSTMLGISQFKFLRLASMGQIRVKAAVGELPTYSVEDINRLKEEAEKQTA